jgi:hypothetical protein
MTEDERLKAWVAEKAARVLPEIENSGAFVSFAFEGDMPNPDAALELGLAIFLDKPVMVVAKPGQYVSGKLRAIADELIRVDINDPASGDKIQQAIARMAGDDHG